MTPRTMVRAASALFLVIGCSATEAPSPIQAHRPGPSASPLVAAAGPRVHFNEVVFAPVLPAALRPSVAAASRRGLVFSVGSGDAAADADPDELPPVPVPKGWIPAPEPTSRQVLGLDDGAFEAAGDPGEGGEEPLFAEEPDFAEDGVEGARAVFEDPGLDEGTWDEDSEEIVVEEIRYIETIEVETRIIEIGTPVLVVDGYSSWGYGSYPVVRSSRRFDPCFTPPGGACWAPVDFDPCWNPCTDPAWGTWNMVGDERTRRGRDGHVGLDVVEDHGSPAPPKAPRPRHDPVVRQDPPSAPVPPSPAERIARRARPEPAVVEIPAADPPRREPVARAARETVVARIRSAREDRDPAPRTTTAVRRISPRAEPVVDVPDAPAAESVASVRTPRPAAEPRTDRLRGRDRSEARPEAREEPRAEAPRPEPVRAPAREPDRGRNGGGRDRTPEVQAPAPATPAPPPPPPPPPSRGSGGKRGR